MKLLYVPLITLFIFVNLPTCFTQEEVVADSVIYQGIDFINGEWGEILALAELEGKTIFLDTYTDWCRPCKVMDKEVFTRPDIGDFFNGNFLNVKMNMEEGEGVALAKKYQIIAYPTLLFLNYDGTVVHRFAGFKDAGGMLTLGRKALDNENNFASLQSKYESGDRSPEFLYNYLRNSFEAADGQQTKIMEEYLATQTDWNTTEIRGLIFQVLDTPKSPIFDHLIKEKDSFIEQFGASRVENQIQSLVAYALNEADNPLEQVDALFQRAYLDRATQLTANYKMNYYSKREDGQNYATEATNYLSSNQSVPEEDLNEIAWNFYDLVTNKEQLKTLCKRVKKLTKKNNTYLNNESSALLYAKLGKTKKALKLAKKAIKIAEKTSSSSASAEELIAELSQ